MDAENPCRALIIILVLVFSVPGQMTGGSFHFSVHSDDPKFFKSAISNAPFYQTPFASLSGGIISHHLLASNEIAGLFLAVRRFNETHKVPVHTIVIIGPDHYGRIMSNAATSLKPWKMPSGLVKTDKRLFQALARDINIVIDDDALSDEHSIGALAGFIGVILPDVKIFPIITGSAMSWDTAGKLGVALSSAADEGVMVLASTDFVHDMVSPAAHLLDAKSRGLIEDPKGSLSGKKITGITCDCRKCLSVLFSYLSERGAMRHSILSNTDSGKITGLEMPVVTYFFVLYGN